MAKRDRAAEKQASRYEDARRLADGEITLEELRKENSFLPLDHILPIDYSKVPMLKYKMAKPNKPLKSMAYWKSEMWELQYVVAHRGDRKRFKRNLSRARRRYRGDLDPAQWGDANA